MNPRLAALEAKSSLKSSHLEDLEREKKRLEVEVVNLKEALRDMRAIFRN